MIRSNIDNEAGKPGRAPRSLLRRLGMATLAICVGAAGLLALGFLWFVWLLPTEEISLGRKAEGIVVFTGGASRTSDALELLAAGHGQRLLISGANRKTNANEIARLNPEFASLARCCVDFDYSLNTLGNAVETRKWAEERKLRSLIVVTSSYHMPRAMVELAHQLPAVTLISFPVVSPRLRSEPWWSNYATARLLALEYLKYVFARIRMLVNPDAGVAE
ncbi:MAG: YdcF family protein [Xanthobacteraceae bacterium]